MNVYNKIDFNILKLIWINIIIYILDIYFYINNFKILQILYFT